MPARYNILCSIIILINLSPGKLPSQVPASEGFVIAGDGTELYYKLFGRKGDTLMMVHGGPGQNMNGIGPDLEFLSRNNVLIMYDQRGCGNSGAGKDTVTVSHHINDLETIRKHFQINQMVLVGQSWGAMLSIMYTSSHPENVKRLLLISPGPPTRRFFDERFASFLKKDSAGQSRVANLRLQLRSENAVAACREIFSINDRFYFADSHAIKRKKGDYCSFNKEALQKQAASGGSTLRSLGNYDLAPLCKNITQPVLLLEGALSPVPPGELEYWRKALPDCRVYFFSRSGHGYSFVEEPRKFLKVATRFFKGKWPREG